MKRELNELAWNQDRAREQKTQNSEASSGWTVLQTNAINYNGQIIKY